MQTVSFLAILGLASVAVATPPCWAPAWGWREGSAPPPCSTSSPIPMSSPASSTWAVTTPAVSTPVVSTPAVSTPLPTSTPCPSSEPSDD